MDKYQNATFSICGILRDEGNQDIESNLIPKIESLLREHFPDPDPAKGGQELDDAYLDELLNIGMGVEAGAYSFELARKSLREKLSNLAKPEAIFGGGQEAREHGKTCPKIPHVGEGYLHGEDDDTPYSVDGLEYCGRCHRALPDRPALRDGGKLDFDFYWQIVINWSQDMPRVGQKLSVHEMRTLTERLLSITQHRLAAQPKREESADIGSGITQELVKYYEGVAKDEYPQADKPEHWPSWKAMAEEMQRNWIGATETHQQERKRADALEARAAKAEEESAELREAAKELLALMDEVPIDPSLGDETDRVFSRAEFWALRAALSENQDQTNWYNPNPDVRRFAETYLLRCGGLTSFAGELAANIEHYVQDRIKAEREKNSELVISDLDGIVEALSEYLDEYKGVDPIWWPESMEPLSRILPLIEEAKEAIARHPDRDYP